MVEAGGLEEIRRDKSLKWGGVKDIYHFVVSANSKYLESHTNMYLTRACSPECAASETSSLTDNVRWVFPA